MDYAHVGGSDPNARFYHDNNNNNINNSNNNNNNPHGNIISQVEAQAQYDSKEQQTLRSRMERRQYELQKRQQQQQQQEPQHIVQDIQWGQIETPLSTYPTSDPRSSFSPEHTFSPESQTYYVPDSNINVGF